MEHQRVEDHLQYDAAVTGARRGDPDSLDALVGWLEGPLLGFARARRSEDPHGVVNEVFVRAFCSLDSFSGGAGDFRAWVFQIARNLIIDQTRARARRVVELATAPTDLPAVAVDGGVGERIQESSRVQALLETLTPDQREVLVLRVVADFTAERTAQIMGRSVGSVRVLQHRALAKLRKEISTDL